MSAPNPPAHAAEAARDAREARRRRAAVAARLVAGDAEAVSAIDWDELDRAPAWLALAAPKLATLQRQVGALLYAAQMRLWIDGPRLGAARAAVGDDFLHALQAQHDLQAFPPDAGTLPRIDAAEKVATRLQVAGASVLLASLSPGPLRDALGTAMAPTAAAPMAAGMAQSLVARAQALAASGAVPAATATPWSRA